MSRTLCLSVFLAFLGLGTAFAQSSRNDMGPPDTSRLLRGRNITGTGATVPHPGVPQGSGPTELDLNIQKRDNQELNSICSNC